MCGIAGYAGRAMAVDDAQRLGGLMSTPLAHRGPDDEGLWTSVDGAVMLAHRRLSIVDLSSLGRNPMTWDAGRLRITYNGEVYNFLELRKELEAAGVTFRSHTDTEVILAAYDRWGEDCLDRFVGMFAFAIWDEQRQRLFLARDRFGKKPLYYSLRNGRLSFASELKALVADPAFPRHLDSEAVQLYLRYGYVPAPYSIFAVARKLPPGHYAVFEHGQLAVRQYWDPLEVALSAADGLSPAEVDARLERLLKKAVERRMIADVPVGAFLSGGIDSSLVVALMQELSTRPVNTFTIRFDNPRFDESPHAAAVARHLGTDHHEETCGVGQMLEIVDRLPDFFDEPFADSSAIPTYLVSAVARRHVKVALSGDGGDELFFGYPRYFYVQWSRWLLRAPRVIRHAAAAVASAVPVSTVRRASHVLRDDSDDPYARFISWWNVTEVQRLAGKVTDNPTYVAARRRMARLANGYQAPALDSVSYLPEDILTKVDRASMAISLETRSPLLDHTVAEFALTLGLRMRTDGRVGKLPLRRLLYRRVPHALVDRPKMGFGVPLVDWLEGPLRERMTAYLEGPVLPLLGLDREPACAVWRQFLANRAHYLTARLWNIFSLAAWVERWAPEPAERSYGS